jgi:hypothetical protein
MFERSSGWGCLTRCNFKHFWLFIFRSQFGGLPAKFLGSRPSGLAVKGVVTNSTGFENWSQLCHFFDTNEIFFKNICHEFAKL